MGSTFKTGFLLAALSGILLLIGELTGGRSGLMIAFGMAIVMNVGSYWFSDKIVLKMYKAQPVESGHRLYDMVERLALRAGLPMPTVYELPSDSPNAFATGRNPEHAAVAATQGIMRLLDDHELEGVMAHELAHVQNRDILVQSVAATIGAAIMMLARMAQFSAMFGSRSNDRNGGSPIAMIAMALIAPMAAMVVQSAISRAREFGADAGGAKIAGDPSGLARALGKIAGGIERVPMDANPATAHLFIMAPFSGRTAMKLFRTHPPTEERIKRLMAIG